jgi:hypothetical protein
MNRCNVIPIQSWRLFGGPLKLHPGPSEESNQTGAQMPLEHSAGLKADSRMSATRESNQQPFQRSDLPKSASKLEAISEPLFQSSTCSEAMRQVLLRVIELGISLRDRTRQIEGPRCVDNEQSSFDEVIGDHRDTLLLELRARLEASRNEGELPEDADVVALSILCSSVLIGLSVVSQDDVSSESLFESVALFVDRLGFHRIRSASRRRHRT